MDSKFSAALRNEQFVTPYIRSLREEHRLGLPARAVVLAELPEVLPLIGLVGTNTELRFGYEGEEPRTYVGILARVTLLSRPAGPFNFLYEFEIVPRLALLDQSVDSRIFQDQTVKEIITKVLEDHGIPADQVTWKLSGDYPKREYCVQYQETALAFITRLAEAEGIYFFSEPSAELELDTLVFADDSTVSPPMAGDPVLPLHFQAGLVAESVQDLTFRGAVVSGKHSLRDFDFLHPDLTLEVAAEAAEFAELEVYDYPGEYFEEAEGRRRAQILQEAAWTERAQVEFSADCRRLSVGRRLTITMQGGDQQEYFVTAVTHQYEHHDVHRDVRETARVEAIRSDVKYRLPRRTPVPVIHGPQTAIVVAPDGAAPEEIHTDEHGRCRVRFHWDRSGKMFDDASCWMRVSQLQTSGSMVLPRVDWEVIIEFLEGNPDRPLITGRLFNGMFMPPYALPEGSTRTSIKTSSTPGGGGVNEIRMEDKAGSEEIMIQSQYDTMINVANNRKKTVGSNETVAIKVNSESKVGANQEVKVTGGSLATVKGDQTITVSGNRSVEVNAVYGLTSGTADTTIKGNLFEMDGNPLTALVDLAAAKAAEVIQAKVKDAVDKVQGAVQAKVDQALGPINDLTAKVDRLQGHMQALADGNLAATGPLVSGSVNLPGADAVMTSMAGASAALHDATSDPAGIISATNAAGNAVNDRVAKALGGARAAISEAMGSGGGAGGGQSMGNKGGPGGAVGSVDESDTATGPGHQTFKVNGPFSETVGALRATVSVQDVATNVVGSLTRNTSAAHVVMGLNDYAEAVEGAKTETELGLVVVSQGGESETVEAALSRIVGGAIVQDIKQDHIISSNSAATFVGTFHQLKAKTKLTLQCGASSIVLDGGGMTITSPLVAITAGTLQLKKSVTDV